MKVDAARLSPPQDLIEPRPVRPGLKKAYHHILHSPSIMDTIETCPPPAPPATGAAVPWRNPPLPVYRRPRTIPPAQTLLERQLKKRLDSLPRPETLSPSCWQQLDSINRKDAARLIDRLSDGTMFLQPRNVRALAAQNWSRAHMRQFLCWLLYLDRGPDNIVGYTDEARRCLKQLMDVMDLNEAQIYLDLSQIQQRCFQHQVRSAFAGWDDGVVQVDSAAIAAMREQMYTDRPRVRSFFSWLIGCDAFGTPFHNVRLSLTQDGTQALIGWLTDQNDFELWTLARLRLPHFAQELSFWHA